MEVERYEKLDLKTVVSAALMPLIFQIPGDSVAAVAVSAQS